MPLITGLTVVTGWIITALSKEEMTIMAEETIMSGSHSETIITLHNPIAGDLKDRITIMADNPEERMTGELNSPMTGDRPGKQILEPAVMTGDLTGVPMKEGWRTTPEGSLK
mgnify:FL=1